MPEQLIYILNQTVPIMAELFTVFVPAYGAIKILSLSGELG